MKRFLDLAIIIVLAPFWIPVVGITALAVLIKLGRPILYRDERAGLHGKPFSLVKFRSMLTGDAPDAERLTRFGRFLRASSLDELPELFNVLKGEMSLVGPRPLPVRYLPRYTPEQNRRHEVLPGITGWAQVNGRNSLDWSEKFILDIEYVESHTISMDMSILFMTLAQLFAPRGINHAGQATMEEFAPQMSSSEKGNQK